MVTHRDLVAFYGEGHVHRCSVEVEQLDLPADARSVLIEVGLPDQAGRGFTSLVMDGTCVLRRHESVRHASTWYAFGTIHGGEMCVSSVSGEVWKLWPAADTPDIFVNTSVARFIEFQLLFDRYCRQNVGQNDGTMALAVNELEEAWHRVDPRALADPEHFHWARWLDDAKLQLGMPPYDY